jgi:hypothetical protein
MSDLFRTFIVPAAHADLARALCALEAGGAGMFTTGLSADGTEPASYFVSTGQVPGPLGMAAPCAVWEQDAEGAWVEVSYEPGNADAVFAASQAADPPLACTLADIEALFVASDITAQEPSTACGRLGLRIVTPPEPTATPRKAKR